ncbi:NUDIX domain-containing protein [Halomicrobium zhouii]|nr:NUDIX domain-containing protein [Halomicrobium zhouii]
MVAVEPEYCHQCGEKLVVQTIHGRERKVCPACGHVHFRNAVPAADVIVRDETDVLLMEPFGRDAWELPGGHPEIEEEPVDAATRELAEETGVEAKPADLRLLSVVHSTHRELHYNMITYVVDYEETEGSVIPGEEARDVKFWPLERIFSSPAETRQIDRRVLQLSFDR